MLRCAFVAGTVFIGMSSGAFSQENLLELDPNNFDENSHIIDNPWWPLDAGVQMLYEGTVVDPETGEQINHRFVDTVTDLTKVINGVSVLVSLEEDFEDGRMIEQEIAFHAQDKDGNVWHLGQLREVYDEVELVGGRVWVIDAPAGAKAGIRMEANPAVGNPEYSQGWAPQPFNWTDSAQVIEMGVQIDTPTGAYSDVMIIAEHDMETEEGVFQTKYYAKGVGLVQIGYLGDDPSKEELFLTEIVALDPAGIERAQSLALEIDQRGYLYNATSAAAPMSE